MVAWTWIWNHFCTWDHPKLCHFVVAPTIIPWMTSFLMIGIYKSRQACILPREQLWYVSYYVPSIMEAHAPTTTYVQARNYSNIEDELRSCSNNLAFSCFVLLQTVTHRNAKNVCHWHDKPFLWHKRPVAVLETCARRGSSSLFSAFIPSF